MLHVYLWWAGKCNSFTITIWFQTITYVWNNSHSLFLPFNEKLFALMSRRTNRLAKKGNRSLNKNVSDISNTLSAEVFSHCMVACVAFHQTEFLKNKGKHFSIFKFYSTCVTYRFEIFALPILHLACCDSTEITKVSKPLSKNGFSKNKKALKLAWKAKVAELKNKNKVKYPSSLKMFELLFPLHK